MLDDEWFKQQIEKQTGRRASRLTRGAGAQRNIGQRAAINYSDPFGSYPRGAKFFIGFHHVVDTCHSLLNKVIDNSS